MARQPVSFCELTPEARRHTSGMGRLIQPHAARLDRRFATLLRKKGLGGAEIRALLAITPAAASRLRTCSLFLEQVTYNAGRLAKLNIAPAQVHEALREFAAMLDPVLAGQFQPAREQLDLAIALALNEAYYQVREAETQALFGIYRAEVEATSLDDLLRRLVRVLTPALRARAGRILLLDKPLSKELARPRFIEHGEPDEALISDAAMRGHYASYWSYPLGGGLVAQFGFATSYPWLPRELSLLEAASERCQAALDRQALESDNLRLKAEASRAEEDERRRIGRELHDEAGQSLLLLRLQLEMMEREAPPGLRTGLANARTVAESVVTEIRRIVAALSPQLLERLGLAAALRHLAARFQKMHPAAVSLRMPRVLPSLPPATEEAIYRVVQEGLQNAAKHSSANSVKVSLRIADSIISLRVSDNGAGFSRHEVSRKPLSFGLTGMRERAALLGGKLETISAPGKGVTVKLELPLTATPTKSNGKNSRITD
jgi:signal transduction histidine kinase